MLAYLIIPALPASVASKRQRRAGGTEPPPLRQPAPLVTLAVKPLLLAATAYASECIPMPSPLRSLLRCEHCWEVHAAAHQQGTCALILLPALDLQCHSLRSPPAVPVCKLWHGGLCTCSAPAQRPAAAAAIRQPMAQHQHRVSQAGGAADFAMQSLPTFSAGSGQVCALLQRFLEALECDHRSGTAAMHAARVSSAYQCKCDLSRHPLSSLWRNDHGW